MTRNSVLGVFNKGVSGISARNEALQIIPSNIAVSQMVGLRRLASSFFELIVGDLTYWQKSLLQKGGGFVLQRIHAEATVNIAPGGETFL